MSIRRDQSFLTLLWLHSKVATHGGPCKKFPSFSLVTVQYLVAFSCDVGSKIGDAGSIMPLELRGMIDPTIYRA